jgi:hypothetical protein
MGIYKMNANCYRSVSYKRKEANHAGSIFVPAAGFANARETLPVYDNGIPPPPANFVVLFPSGSQLYLSLVARVALETRPGREQSQGTLALRRRKAVRVDAEC